MNQVVSNISKKSYFSGSEEDCNKYMSNYGLTYGEGMKEFQILPFEPKRKNGDFGELMQIQLGNYKPIQDTKDTSEIDNVIKKKIAEIIQNNDAGIKRHQLLALLIQNGYSIPDRKMRALVEELINEDGFAIESSEDGYRIIKNSEQLKTAIKYLKNKAFPLFERANNLKKNFYNDKSVQLSFEEFFTD